MVTIDSVHGLISDCVKNGARHNYAKAKCNYAINDTLFPINQDACLQQLTKRVDMYACGQIV